MEKKKLSRREFLRVSAVGAAGLAAAACAPATPQIIEKVIKETVVVEKEVEKVVKETVEVQVETVIKETVEVEKIVEVERLSMRQSPDLADLVSAGTLPPLEERMALEPMVLPVVEEIGTYGGDVSLLNVGESYSAWEYQYLLENPCRWNAEASCLP